MKDILDTIAKAETVEQLEPALWEHWQQYSSIAEVKAAITWRFGKDAYVQLVKGYEAFDAELESNLRSAT